MAAPTKNCTAAAINNGNCPHPGQTASTSLIGDYNTVTNITLRHSNNHGLSVSGDHNTIDNILVDNTDWLGTLTYIPLALHGNHNVLRRSTVQRFGNAGVVTSIPNTPPKPLVPANATQKPPQPMAGRKTEVAYCHIHHGGLIGKDSAALYTGGWDTSGLEWHHSWIHSATEKCVRADDQSRNMSVHHNVIFDCGESFTDTQSSAAGFGLVLKGNGHAIWANTIWGANRSSVCMPSCVERLKSFRPQYPRQLQNNRSQLFNTAAHTLDGACGCPSNGTRAPSCGGNKSALFRGHACNGLACDLGALRLQDPAHFDFRPRQDSPLVDSGILWPPYTDGFLGSAPDIGAYEFGASNNWRAGCVGLEGCQTPQLGRWRHPSQ
jgi:hypothetical protein